MQNLTNPILFNAILLVELHRLHFTSLAKLRNIRYIQHKLVL